jgi:four helix bundle protein
MSKFRFEQLEIWKRAADVALKMFDIADDLADRKLYRFSEQLRGSALSAPNNIAEGAGSNSNREFAHFLNIARRSTFESASMILMFERRGIVDSQTKAALLTELDELCRMITAFSRTLSRKT